MRGPLFFALGENVVRYPHLYQETLYRQHAVGNHTYHHSNGWHTDNDAYQEDVARCDHVLRRYHSTASRPSPLFRPPYGKIKRQQIRALRPNYTLVMWDILSGDFDPAFDAKSCLQKSIGTPGGYDYYFFTIATKRRRTSLMCCPAIWNILRVPAIPSGHYDAVVGNRLDRRGDRNQSVVNAVLAIQLSTVRESALISLSPSQPYC